jgi:hypothetical protein
LSCRSEIIETEAGLTGDIKSFDKELSLADFRAADLIASDTAKTEDDCRS